MAAAAPAVPAAPAGAPDLAAQQTVHEVLRPVGHLTGHCGLVLAQDKLNGALLRDMGWSCFETAASFQQIPTDVDAILVVSHGNNFEGVDTVMATLSRHMSNKSCPMVMVVFIGVSMPSEISDPDPTVSARAKVEFACRMAQKRGDLYEAGANEVLALLPGETIQPNRLIECIHRTDYICGQLKQILENELVSVEERSQRLLHTAQQKLLAMLPGRILENLPLMDRDFPETRDTQGELLSMGDYTVQRRLGAGTFGAVYLVACPKRGTCAMKVIPKRNLKKMSALISLDHETSFMLFAAHHPNIVRAHEAIHGPQNFYIVMEYAGALNIHKFAKQHIEMTGGWGGLHVDKLRSFCSQEANAVSHLHWHNIVHRDIKPENWIVSDDGNVLKLADFGLAMQLSGPGHPLKQCCGSLPFCPPEVFNCKLQPDPAGYDGLAADIWSLGVGFCELVLGPFAVERLLNWLPTHPTDSNILLQGLRSIPEHWAAHSGHDQTGIGEIIPRMLQLIAADRWKITQIMQHPVIVEAAAAASAHANAPRFQMRPLSAGYPQNSMFFGNQRESYIIIGNDPRPLAQRLGGTAAVTSIFNRAFENFSRTTGFAEHIAPYIGNLHALCTLLCQENTSVFDAAEASREDRRLRSEVTSACHGLPFVERHFQTLRDHLRTVLREMQFDEVTISEAISKFGRLGREMCSFSASAMDRAQRTNTPAWRARVLAMATAPQVSAYSEALQAKLRSSFVLGNTSLGHMQPRQLHDQWMAFLHSDRQGTMPVALPQDATRPAEHLVLVSSVRDALRSSQWPDEVVDTIHYLLLQSWRDVQEL